MVVTHIGPVPDSEAVCRMTKHKGLLRVVGKTLVCDECRAEQGGDGHYGKHYPKICTICQRRYVANGFQQLYCPRCTKEGTNRKRRENYWKRR